MGTAYKRYSVNQPYRTLYSERICSVTHGLALSEHAWRTCSLALSEQIVGGIIYPPVR